VTSVFAIAGITIANGGDNIGVYIPLLTTMAPIEKIQMVIVFVVLVYVWCMAAKKLAGHPPIARQLDRYGHIMMPIVLFLLGIFILYESSTLSLLLR
jgi:cadmium resistance protein CadD (predicted permease)